MQVLLPSLSVFLTVFSLFLSHCVFLTVLLYLSTVSCPICPFLSLRPTFFVYLCLSLCPYFPHCVILSLSPCPSFFSQCLFLTVSAPLLIPVCFSQCETCCFCAKRTCKHLFFPLLICIGRCVNKGLLSATAFPYLLVTFLSCLCAC
jgi:hypothetical protein